MKNCCPFTSVEATGKTTVCVVEPVKFCISVLETVSVVVPAAVAVVVKPGMNPPADRFVLESHLSIADGVGVEVAVVQVKLLVPAPLEVSTWPAVPTVNGSGSE